MTTSAVLGVLARRWYVATVALALVAVAMVMVHSRPPVYWSQVEVVLLAPKSEHYPNSIEQTNAGVIAMAGMVANYVNQDQRTPATASAGVTLAGEGVRHGRSVSVPNSGGQWALNFERPVLDVQAVGKDSQLVRLDIDAQIDRIEEVLLAIQRDDGIARRNFITASVAPAEARVVPMDGNPMRALAAVLLLGLWFTVVMTVAADRAINKRAANRRLKATPAEQQPRGAPDPARPVLATEGQWGRWG